MPNVDMGFSEEGWDLLNQSKPRSSAVSAATKQARIRRRNRMITSCLECRRRKLKCDKLHPCTNCSKFARDCNFLAPALDSASQMKLTAIKEKMGSLERVLEQDVAKKKELPVRKRNSPRKPSVDLPGENDSNSDNEDAGPEDEKDLEPTPLAVLDAAFEDDTNDDIIDLGIRMGKLRLTERIGGFFRPKMTEELTFTLTDPTMDHRSAEEKATPLPASPGSLDDFLEPGPTYIAPGAGFIFGDVGNKKNLMDFLPSKVAADSLLDQYLQSVHYINRVVHWPSFQVQYDNFWTNVLLGIEPAASIQTLVFSIMFSAVASMDDLDVAATFSRPKRAVLTNFQTGTEVALCKAHFLRSTKIEVIQALIIYLIPMCRTEMSRAHSVLVSMAIRLAECMGLHRDPKDIFGSSPVEAHVRRMVWYQVCFLDMRTNDAQGPRPVIRREDYDTKFPYNINDSDLLSANPQDSDTAWTDMTVSRMRFECNEMHRVLFIDRQRLEKKQISLTHVLGKIESFRRAMEAKYHPIFDPTVPIKNYARLVMEILLLRMHIGVLHRYHNSVSSRIPDRLRQIILTSGTQITENAVKLETMPEFKPWRWCAGAYQQYHTAFLLLVEIFAYPMRKEADRIWNCLDYVFETDRTLSRAQKGRIILTELRDKIAVYRDIRKIRAPVSMMKRLYQKPPRRVNESTDPGLPMNGPSSEQPPDKIPVVDQLPNTAEYGQDFKKPAQSDSLSPYSSAHIDFDSSARRPSTESPANSSSPSHSADPAFHTWTFDVPQTFLMQKSHDKDNWSEMPGLRPRGAASATSPPNYSSPSAASTSDSWPPFIMAGQHDWSSQMPQVQNLKLQQEHAQAQPYQQQPALNTEMTAIADITNMDNNGNAGNMQVPPNMNPNDLLMDIDWNEWDKIFPPEVNTGILNMPTEVTFNMGK